METIKIMFVCHGNICRSPMAEFVMKEIVKSSLKYNYIIESRATSYEEIGNDIYYESKKILDKHNIKYQRREAKRITKKEYEEYDYIIVMDDNNIYNLNRIIGNDYLNKVNKLLYFMESDRDVSDPWYTRRFEDCYNDIYNGCLSLYKHIENNH